MQRNPKLLFRELDAESAARDFAFAESDIRFGDGVASYRP